MNTLADSTPFFIRCLKPNTTKMPQDWNYRVVRGQLQALSVRQELRNQRHFDISEGGRILVLRSQTVLVPK